jgi:hypothetical protein
MDATVLRIAARRRPAAWTPAAARDFELEEAGTLPAERVLDDATLSVYCVDAERRAILFVRTPPEVDLGHVPFVYAAQYEHATEVVAVPYEAAFALAERAGFDAAKRVVLLSDAAARPSSAPRCAPSKGRSASPSRTPISSWSA